MRVGIEFRQITPGSSGGILQNQIGVLKLAFNLFPQDEFFVYCTIFNRQEFGLPPANTHLVTVSLANYFEWMDKQLEHDKIDVLFRSYPIEDQLHFPPERQIFYIPDIQHEDFPEFFSPETLRSRRISFNSTLARAGAIGTISEFTRKALQNHKWTQCQDFFLMCPALQFDKILQDGNLSLSFEEQKLIPQKPFFYFPANLWPHKNHRRLFNAFEEFLSKTGSDMELVLTGHPEGWPVLQSEFPQLPVRHLGFVSPALVQELHQRARALVFFSLHEGFGIPLLEAFHAGTPVICSNTTSLPEVGQEAVLTCDPTDTQAICQSMIRIDQDENLRKVLIENGKKRLSDYTWQNSAENLMAACQRVADRAARYEFHRPKGTPLVSIVTPSYNQGKFLRLTIESVLNQTYKNIEYIVMDGGSTDNSVDILKSYGDRFFWLSEPDQGQANAINKGFARARGEILAFLNSDDILLPDAVEKIVTAFQNHPEWDLIYGKAHYIDENGEITGMYNTADFSYARFVNDNCICQPATFWRSRIANLVGPLNDHLYIALDQEYWFRIYHAGGYIQHIHEILASSRLYPQTKTMSSRKIGYKEIFMISQKYAGYVSLNYYYGLWHYRVWEQDTPQARRLRLIPKSFKTLALLHYARDRRAYLTRNIPKYLLMRARRFLLHRLPFVLDGFTNLKHQLARVSRQRPVIGCDPDNLCCPRIQVLNTRNKPDGRYYFAGSALDDCVMTLRINGREDQKHSLKNGYLTRFEIKLSPNQVLEISFSKSIKISDGRKVSFQLTETNLFTEQDAYR